MFNNGTCQECGSDRVEATGDLFWCADCGALLADTRERTSIGLEIKGAWHPSVRSGRKCSVPGCGLPHQSHGYCQHHNWLFIRKERQCIRS